jgi:hypothetical protein
MRKGVFSFKHKKTSNIKMIISDFKNVIKL